MKMVDLAEHAEIGALYPAIAAAAIEVGTPQIRNQGTVGGNLNQRPRCWYFRNEEFVCFKKGGNQCFSPAGENQFHAIFGNGPSFIVHPSSLAVPLVAYGATFRLLGPKGERMVPAADYFTMPTLQNVQRENVLAPDELLTHVILPAPGSVKSGHYEVRYKASHDWPIAFATVAAGDERHRRCSRRASSWARSRRCRGARRPPSRRSPARRSPSETAAAAAEAALRDARAAQPERLQDPGREDRRQARHPARRRPADRLKPETSAHGIADLAEDHRGRALPQAPHQEHVRHMRWWTRPKRRSTIRTTRPPDWCVKTQTGFGPDRQPVRPDVCCGERGCCQSVNGNRRRQRMKKIALVGRAVGPDAGDACPPSRPSITGTYVEARTAEVFAGACIMNGEGGDDRTRGAARLEGRSRAASTASPLDGLAVVAAVAGDTNLGIHEIGGESTPARAALFVDARATPAQRKALVAMVKSLAGSLIGSVVQETAAPIQFVDNGHDIRVSTEALRLTVEKHLNHDASCGNKQWFHPLRASIAPRWARPPRTRSAARRSARSGATRTSARRSSARSPIDAVETASTGRRSPTAV